MSSTLKQAQGFLDFVNASPTPYHVVENVKKQLTSAGFACISERLSWAGKLKKNGKYFVTRNSSSIIAFTVGGQYRPGNGIAIVGGHTDSPTLRVKPTSDIKKDGFTEVGVETYGGGIWHTWFDRDLSLAGRVFIRNSTTGNYEYKLLKIDRPILRIPTLAIHLDKERGKFEFNKETQLRPVLGTDSESLSSENAEENDKNFEVIKSVIQRHNKKLVKVISEELNGKPEDIEDFELVLFDTQKSCLGGLENEFIFSPRLDNQVTCYSAIQGLIQSTENLQSETGIRLVSLFDHEEIGSQSAQGADSSFLPDILHRLTSLTFNPTSDLSSQLSPDHFFNSMSKSFVISSDMAHAVHPNYSENYEALNRPKLNAGPVFKINANQRYVTNSPGIVLMKNIASIGKVPMQLFVIRNDSPCGSTIGPMIAAKLGIRTLDIGNPQLSMHSIRETCGSKDIEQLVNLFRTYFEKYTTIESKIIVD